MKPCEEYRKVLIETYYNELPADEKEQVVEHLASCKECSAEYKKLESTLAIMNKRERVEPDETYWKTYWNSLNLRLENEQKVLPLHKSSSRFAWQPAWAYGIAAMLLVAIGLYFGKLLYSPEPTKQQPSVANNGLVNGAQATNPPVEKEQGAAKQTPQIPNQSGSYTLAKNNIDNAAQAYLDRSKTMLLGIINADDDSPSDFKQQQKISRDLLQEAVDLKPSLIEPDQQRIRQLINDLEVILLQLANMEEQTNMPGIELVKKGVNQKSILLKINMEEMRMMKSATKGHKASSKDKTSL